jgi:hypothetical protein
MQFTRVRQRSAFVATGLFILLILGSRVTFAQITTGEILGTVRDLSGAIIPGAKVTLRNEQTHLTLSTTSNGSGLYYFTPILIGNYAVTVSKTGFETVTHSNITVQIQASVTVDFTLRPGKVTTAVQVTAVPPQLQTTDASTGQVLTTTQVNNLPLVTRNYTFLAQLSPGVTSFNPGEGTSHSLEYSGSFVANGAYTELNNYILNGIDNNNDTIDFLNGTAYVALPPPDALSEFKVQTSDFTAEYGRAGGAVINAVVKSGTNQFHGDVWEYMQNNALDANGFFENASHTPLPKLTYNQFGFTLGGPVVIPHIYNGHNKTFFFADFQGTRVATAQFEQANVPTPAEISSGYTNFQDTFAATTQTATDILGRTFNANAIMDPATTRSLAAGETDPVTGLVAQSAGYVRDPFYLGSLVGVTNFTSPAQEALMNQLPASRLDPNAIKLLKLLPAANTAGENAGTVNNYAADIASPESENHFDIRGDQNFSYKDQMNAAVDYDTLSEFLPGNIPSGYGANGFNNGNISDFSLSSELSETHIFSPTLINDFRLGYNRLYSNDDTVLINQPGIPAMFGIQGVSQANGNYGLPSISVDGLTQFGPSIFASPNVTYSNTVQIEDNVTKVYGKHTFKGGFEAQFLNFPWDNPTAAKGAFNFGEYTGIPNVTGSSSGEGMADILLIQQNTTVPGGINMVGGPCGVSDTNNPYISDKRHYYGAYFQDDFKVSPRLTLNMGLRWEFFGQINENNDAILIPGESCGLNKACGATYIINSKIKSEPLSSSFTSLLAKDGIALKYSSVPGLLNTPLDDFAPRIGVAWQVTPRLVARAGYGIYFGGFENLGGAADPGFTYPSSVSLSSPPHDPGHPIVYANGVTATLEQGLLNLEPVPNSPSFSAEGLGLTAFQSPWITGNTQEWNLTFQYQVTPNQTVSVGYTGSLSIHQLNSDATNMPNEILPPGTSLTNGCAVTGSIDSSCLPWPDFSPSDLFTDNDGDSYYASGFVEWQRRFSQGLQTLLNYTYSRCMTDLYPALGIGGESISERADNIPGFGGLFADYRFCGSDIPNVFHADAIWQLPFGRGERFGRNMSKLANVLVGGWQAQGIVTLQNGFPYDIACAVNTNGYPSGQNCVPDLVPGQNLYAGQSLPGDFLNIKAFRNPPIDTTFNQSDFAVFGGMPSQIHGPGYNNLDFSIFKNFKISESKSLQFRAEFFNFLNTPQFANDFVSTNYLSTVGFSQINGTVNNPVTGTPIGRMVQLALKFLW